MLDSFWTIEGITQNSIGHLSLKKLPIADYIHKAFNIVKFGGRIWWFNWDKSFYIYDADNVFIEKEVCDIMDAVGNEMYSYNGHITSDKSQMRFCQNWQ